MNIDPDALFESASEKAAGSRKPQELAPGRYTAILEPSAVLDLVGFFFTILPAPASLDKRSCFNERMGKKIFGDNITLWDDVYHPLQIGRAVRRRRHAASESTRWWIAASRRIWSIRAPPRKK